MLTLRGTPSNPPGFQGPPRSHRGAAAFALAVAVFTPAAVVASAGPVTADEGPEIVPITDPCPVPEGGYRYFSDFFEYRIRVYLTGCPWYDGRPAVVEGALTRSDPVMGPEQHDMTVVCEAGAPPPADDRPHAHNSGVPAPPVADPAPGLPRPAGAADGHHEEAHRPPDNCVLSIIVKHPPVERAHYEGTLHYPGPTGEKSETLSLDCMTVEDFGGCDAPGSPPNIGG